MEVVAHTDGASRGNPGPAAIGVVIQDSQGHILLELGEALPPTTNNVAEYTAVIRALERARAMGARRVRCLLDSQLVVRQLNGAYKVRHHDMLPLYRRVLELVGAFDEVTFEHVPREMNAEADRLANLALDSRAGALISVEPPPGSVVRRLAERIGSGDDEGARACLMDGFRYRRPARGEQELDADAFIRMVRERSLRWQVQHEVAAGGMLLTQATYQDAHGRGASLLISEVAADRLAILAEYRDPG
ncbi:MAG TPA: ribonuclease HI family protein [Candidatus Limnocylindrales bacterium]|nr:ribonuclease HI family protein [Candidatus Limnocylindrales bacterium]